MRLLQMWFLLFLLFPSFAVPQESAPQVQTTFRVRYVADGSVYLEGGRTAGLTEGMKLVIKQSTKKAATDNSEKGIEPGVVAELKVVSVAASSAVCDIVSTARPIVEGDEVTLPQSEVQKMVDKQTLSNTRQYPAVVSFSEGDPLDEDVRLKVPRPPLPEVNQVRGRIGFDYSTIRTVGSPSATSSEIGMVVRADMTRIYGTHWNLTGYWRGRLQSSGSTGQATLQDLINRTYTLGLNYVNPQSRWTFGVGRLYLPWATSLQVIDGGYAGAKVKGPMTLGVFGGSSPDPTAWNYDPSRRIGGGFVNFQGGSFENLWYSSTTGLGESFRGTTVDRPFAFTDSSISYKRFFSLYHSMQIDRPRPNPGTPPVGTGLGQSFLTVRIQPIERLSLDANHTYFRDIPTYDVNLLGTGLLDKYLFQGFSAGGRLQLPLRFIAYGSVGQSSNSSDTKKSLNTSYGLTLDRLWRTGVRLDARFSRFNSSFADGTYRTYTISRDFGETFRWDLQYGDQKFVSPLSKDTGGRFVNSYLDMTLGRHFFIETGVTVQRGTTENYNQVTTTLGYRFNNRSRKRGGANVAPTHK